MSDVDLTQLPSNGHATEMSREGALHPRHPRSCWQARHGRQILRIVNAPIPTPFNTSPVVRHRNWLPPLLKTSVRFSFSWVASGWNTRPSVPLRTLLCESLDWSFSSRTGCDKEMSETLFPSVCADYEYMGMVALHPRNVSRCRQPRGLTLFSSCREIVDCRGSQVGCATRGGWWIRLAVDKASLVDSPTWSRLLH